MFKVIVLALVLLAAIAANSDATADYRRGGIREFVFTPPPLEAQGCYFYRGRRWCGRYCYYEINGKRYCQRREREAVPQAGIEFEPIPETLK